MERERGRRRDQYGESVKSNAPALRSPVRKLERRQCVLVDFDIDTVDNAPLFFPLFSSLSFFLIPSSFFLSLSRRRSVRREALISRTRSEGRVTQICDFFRHRYHRHRRADPFVLPVKRKLRERQGDRGSEGEERKGRRPLSLSSECHDCSVCYDFWTNDF